MKCIDKARQSHSVRARLHVRKPARWRVGNASVSTEELQAWQLGPTRTDTWLVAHERRSQTRF